MFIYFIYFLTLIYSDVTLEEKELKNEKYRFEIVNEKEFGISELLPCDILVKPNHNWLPGTSLVKGGNGFGHVAIVIKGSKDTCSEEILKKTIIFESHARNIPEEFQLRKIEGFNNNNNPITRNTNFGKQYSPYRYRLRPDISDEQKEEIIQFILEQDNDTSSWRSLKKFPSDKLNPSETSSQKWGDKSQWYCSMLIWQAFYIIAGIDLDLNQGVMVYPNDLIAHPFFENNETNKNKRVRF